MKGWVLLGALAALVSIAVIVQTLRASRERPPREPRTDFPWPGDAYRAPVRAVTPRGITVRQARCCQWGHKSPEQAVAHAEQIRARIERTGR